MILQSVIDVNGGPKGTHLVFTGKMEGCFAHGAAQQHHLDVMMKRRTEANGRLG